MRNGIWIGKRKIFPWKPGNLAEYPLKIPGKMSIKIISKLHSFL